jgi:hypothetical protein
VIMFVEFNCLGDRGCLSHKMPHKEPKP